MQLDRRTFRWRLVGLALRQVIQAAPLEATLLLLLLALGGLVPVGVLGFTRALVDGLVAGLGEGVWSPWLWWPLLGLALAFALDFLLAPWVAYLQGAVNERLTARVHLLLMDKVGGLPDLTPFENPSFHDELQVLRDQAPYQPLNLLIFLGSAFRGSITVAGVLLLLLSAAPLFPLLLLLATLPQAILTFRLQKGVWEAVLFTAPEARRMRYFAEALLEADTAKEVRSFEEIRFEQVGFTYPDGRRALQDVSFTLRRGSAWPWWGRTGRARPPWSSCSCASTIPARGASWWTGWICVSWILRPGAAWWPRSSRTLAAMP
ncbi:MAG: hypothetical protein KatS3mg070_2237 [Meiothermus sp.]|nr:MAG: hypothetical protein KatS3mg070_2237 [Meiothermus sp.]